MRARFFPLALLLAACSPATPTAVLDASAPDAPGPSAPEVVTNDAAATTDIAPAVSDLPAVIDTAVAVDVPAQADERTRPGLQCIQQVGHARLTAAAG
jgi:hypothetical protein